MSFYTKNKSGEYIPIEFEQIITKDWENKTVVVKVGSDENPASADDEEETANGIGATDTLNKIETSFIVTRHSISFEILGNTQDLKNQPMAVRVTGGDSLTDLGDLQKIAKQRLRGKVKKVIVLPVPLTVGEYKEVMDIKKRCDNRRDRRGK